MAGKTKAPSRPQLWADAVSEGLEAVERAKEAMTEAMSALEALQELQGEYQSWKDNLPESLQSSAVGEKLDAVCDLDLAPSDEDIAAIEQALSEAESADLPLGFGRD